MSTNTKNMIPSVSRVLVFDLDFQFNDEWIYINIGVYIDENNKKDSGYRC